jgi:tripartite-type tricarboxylate transporter receptor subunit TctC
MHDVHSHDPQRRRTLTALAALAAAAAMPRLARAALPIDGPLTIVVPYAPGGSSDRAGRLVGERLQARHGVTVVVDNRTGAGGRIAAQQVKRASAEQNLVMVGNPATMVIAPVVFKDAGYDGVKDFQPLSQVSEYEFGVAVGPGVPVREFSHLVAWLRANPDKANFGVPATGSLPHFFALMLGDAVKLSPQVVGYRGSGPLANDLIGGQLPVAVDTLDTLYPLHAAGKIRILAASGAKRAPFAQDVPTFREAGFGLTATGWNAFFAAATMPAAKAQAIAAAIRDVMQEDALRKAFAATLMTPVVATQAQTEAMLKAYRAQWLPVVQKSGFQP